MSVHRLLKTNKRNRDIHAYNILVRSFLLQIIFKYTLFLPRTGPCQPFKSNQSFLCSKFQAMVQGQSRVKKVCNHWRASCHVNITLRKEREDRLWGYCYCDSLCKTLGDCCVDFDEWYVSFFFRKSNILNNLQKTELQDNLIARHFFLKINYCSLVASIY